VKLVPPPEDAYPDVLAELVGVVLREGVGAGAEVLAPIAYSRRLIPKRPGLSRKIQGQIFRRDRFTCRYCGGRLILTPLMELIGGLYPEAFPFHPNWKGGETHPAVLSCSPVVDHIVPGSAGGDWADPENLVTACWPCNGRKADFTLEQLGWEVRVIREREDWDGLTSSYPSLWRVAGEPKPSYHGAWIAALGCEGA
jgi:5-methylcytosine-specific restriction endonuclease McrA